MPQQHTHTLIVEAVDAVDAGTLVVAAQNEEILGVLDLVSKQEADRFQRLWVYQMRMVSCCVRKLKITMMKKVL
jgi:hypothetical protein